MAVPLNAALVAQRLLERFPDRDTDIFDGVMVVDMCVAVAGDAQAKPAVLAQQCEHVIEKADAGGGSRTCCGIIEVDGHGDTGLGCMTGDGSSAGHGYFISPSSTHDAAEAD